MGPAYGQFSAVLRYYKVISRAIALARSGLLATSSAPEPVPAAHHQRPEHQQDDAAAPVIEERPSPPRVERRRPIARLARRHRDRLWLAVVTRLGVRRWRGRMRG